MHKHKGCDSEQLPVPIRQMIFYKNSTLLTWLESNRRHGADCMRS